MPNSVHYVKFLRGSTTAWENLQANPGAISNDTLYFIYDSANNVNEGKLYLGQKLISGVGSGIGEINFNDIGDIYIDEETLADKQILTYNDTTNQWENISLSMIIDTAVHEFVGASSREDGMSGLVPAPKAGDEEKFLRGDKQWVTINLPKFDTGVFQNIPGSDILTLAGITAARIGTIPVKTAAGIDWAPLTAGNISRQTITEEELDNLIAQQLANETIIYMVPSQNAASPNNYDEYMVINGEKEFIGSIGNVNLTDYVQKSVFNTHVENINNVLYDTNVNGTLQKGLINRVEQLETGVGNLNELLLSQGNSTLVQEVNTINSRLQWHELLQQV